MVGNASRENGKLGGRPVGSGAIHAAPEIKKARHRQMLDLRDLCRVNEAKHVATLEWIAANSESHNARIAAIGMLFDRGRGRPIQPHDGDGQGGPITFLEGSHSNSAAYCSPDIV